MTDKTTRQRRKEIQDHRQRTQFHSVKRIEFFRHLPCEVTGKQGHGNIVNAHTAGGGVGRRGPYTSIVPLWWTVHTDFDEISDAKFEEKYGRTKQSIRDRAPYYHRMWLDHLEDAA